MYLDIDLFKIKSNNVAPGKGKILIAEPFLQGPYFNRSVVYLTEHNQDGTVGFVLNKKTEYNLDEVVPDFPRKGIPVFLGGPVAPETVNFIHCIGDILPGSIKIKDNLYWGGDFEVLKSMISRDLIQKNQIKFFVGYSGWELKQLEREMHEDSWMVNDIAQNEILTDRIEQSWQRAIYSLGDKYKMWTTFPENPTLN